MTTTPRLPLFPGSTLRLVLSLLYHKLRVFAFQGQVIIDNTDPRISYLPSVCNNTGTVLSSTCTAPWQVVNLTDATNGTVTSTFGPTAAGGNLIPQLFLILRGLSFDLITSSLSNATANITVLASPSNVFVSTTFNSSMGHISTVDLPPEQDITLGVTYIRSPDGEPTRLDIDSVVVYGSNSDGNDTSVSRIPLPSSSTLPSFIISGSSASTATSRPQSSLAQPKGTIVGESLAGFFGLVLILISVYVLFRWRRWRRQLAAEVIEMQTGEEGKDPATETHL